eukprot:gene6689-7779_t
MIPDRYKMAKESIIHNVKAGRRCNARWAKSQIYLQSVDSLSRRGKTINLEGVPTTDKSGNTKMAEAASRRSGPYSPKTYDGDFLKHRTEEISILLERCTVIADCHFAFGRDKDAIKGVRFLVPYPETSGKRKRDHDDIAVGVDSRRAVYNQLVRSIRARVESPFGLMKDLGHLESLKFDWSTSEYALRRDPEVTSPQ